MIIAYLGEYIPDVEGTVRYQRIKYLSKHNALYMLIAKNTSIPDDFENRAYTVRSRFNVGLMFLLWRLCQVWDLNRGIRVDIVITKYHPLAMIEGYILKKLGIKWVAEIWDHPEQAVGATLYSRVIFKTVGRFIRYKLLKRADLIICAILPEALASYNIPPSKILKITNGVDLELVKPEGS